MAAFTSPTNADWSAASFLTIAGAIAERAAVLLQVKGWLPSGGARALWDGELFAAGDDVQAVAVLGGMQRWVDEMADSGYWLQVSSGLPDPDGATWTFAAMRSDIGMGSGWTAYTTHPDESGMASYRRVQAGDIVGPWVFDELQQCLSRMSVTRVTAATTNGTGQTGAAYSVDGRDAAIAAAEAARVGISSSQPALEMLVEETLDLDFNAMHTYGNAVYGLPAYSGVPALVWDLWIEAVGIYDTFAASDSGLVEGWNKVGSGLGASASVEVGPTEFPAWPPTDESIGFKFGGAVAVMQWSFSHSS